MVRALCFVVVSLFVAIPSVAQWQKLPGPFGGYASTFNAIGNTVFAGTDDGLYSTSDYGEHWLPSGLQDSTVMDIFVVPLKGQTVLLATTSFTPLFQGTRTALSR